MRKILSVILAISMVMCFASPIFAAGNGYGADTEATTKPPYTPPTPPSEVTKVEAVKNADAAIEKALASNSGKAEVVIKGATTITPEAFKVISEKTAQANVAAVVHADTMSGINVASRWYIDPAKAAALPTTINLKVSTGLNEVKPIKDTFEKFFVNRFVVISLGQKAAYGMDMRLAVKVNLEDVGTTNLTFVAYDRRTNTYTPILNPRYIIDRFGYLHFSTPVGGEIVITQGTLKLK